MIDQRGTMTWTLYLPHRGDRAAPLSEVAEAARHLPQDEDRQVCRQLVLDWRLAGLRTVGDALDHLNQLTSSERRALLDKARTELGLPSTSEVDARQHVAGITRVELVQGLQRCHAPDCSAIPTTSTGSWALVNVARWHCPAHAHHADPGDMDDLGIGVRYSENGVLVPDDPAADARAAAEAESRQAQIASATVDRQADAVTAAEHERARTEQLRAEMPEHLRGAA